MSPNESAIEAATLYVFGGLPACGKSTLARHLAQVTGAAYLRIDSAEQAMRDAGALTGPEGYLVCYALARDNLRIGNSVVADSVNSIEVTRSAWREVAQNCGAQLCEIEVLCSDREEHRRRVESRRSDVPGLRLPNWRQVLEREYEPWPGNPIVVDTAGVDAQTACAALVQRLRTPR